MTQTARPASDITTTNWTTAPLFSKLNDASDATTVRNNNGVTTAMEVKLASLNDPNVGTGHVLNLRAFATGSGAAEKWTVELYQGTTLIATAFADTNVARTTMTLYQFTLSGAQADAITDYTDLRVRVRMSTGGASEFITVADIWLDIPNVTVSGAALLSGAGALAVAATQRVAKVVASLTGLGDLVADGFITPAPTEGPAFQADAFQVDAFQAQAAPQEVFGAASLTGVGDLSASGKRLSSGAAVLSGAGALQAAGKAGKYGAAALAGTGALQGVGVRRSKGAAALTGTGTLSVPATKRTAMVAAALTGVGDLFANGETTGRVYGAAVLSASGTLAANAVVLHRGAAVLTGVGALSVPNVKMHRRAAAVLTGVGAVGAVGVPRKYGAAVLGGQGTLQAVGRRAWYGQAVLSGAGTLVAAPKTIKYGSVVLTGLGSMSVVGKLPSEGPPDYRLDLCDLSGTLLRSDIMALDFGQELVYAYALNGPGAIDFSLPTKLALPEDYIIGQRTLKLYRNNVLVWGGYLHEAEGDRDWVRFGGRGWYEGLRRRLVDENFHFYSIEALDIAWQLIAHTQTKTDLGIVRDPAEIASGKVRSRDYCCDDFTLVSEAIEDLAGMYEGFDFWVTPDKVWKTKSPRRGLDRTSSIVFDAQTNTSSMSVSQSAEDMATEVFYVGPNPDECRDIESLAQNVLTYGRHELGVDMTNMKSQGERDERAVELLRYQSVPLFQVQLVAPRDMGIIPLSFDLGDRVRVKSNEGWMTFDRTMRVIDFAVTVGLDCVEETTVTLDSVFA